MAKADVLEEAVQGAASGPMDVLVGVTGPADIDRLRTVIAKAGSSAAGSGLRMLIAYQGVEEPSAEADGSASLVTYKVAAATGNGAYWLTSGATYNSLFALARTTNARACVIVNSDLEALEKGAVQSLAAPVLAGESELVMPIYAQSRFEGLLNSGILAPLTRALYGKRVRYPLAQDFAVAAGILPTFEHPSKRVTLGESLFWPATEAAIREKKVSQVHVDVRHEGIAQGVDLPTVLTQVLGPLFSDVEANAPVWQRTRGSHAIPTLGQPFAAHESVSEGAIDTKPMVDSFLLASNNLQDLWSLVLPPVTQLELKRMTRVTPEQFKLPDELWVRIIYDFALAHRLKTLSRTHLMGAFAPIYLAWVASYAKEVATISDAAAELRVEKLAQAFEVGKTYLLSRWRWPDRFNP
jgi:hypothetical protein